MEFEAPELTTFGSVLRYAIELEAASSAFYEAAILVLPGDARSTLARELAAQHANRRRLLERTRQLKLNEVVLEPVSGLESSRFMFDPTPAPRDEVLPRAIALEGNAERFYAESAVVAKALLVEATRTFRKLGEENARNAARLRGGPA